MYINFTYNVCVCLHTVQEVKPAIPLWACMQRFVGTSDIEDFRSPAVADNSTGKASVSRLFASFPRYLVLHMCRYYVDDKWQPQKLEVEVTKELF
jgi:ubiquitin carboxyl-terminal hydrolase 5/13